MYAITGITGQVGGALARALLADGQSVRAIVRNVEKADAWAAQGCTIAQADMRDGAALTAARWIVPDIKLSNFTCCRE